MWDRNLRCIIREGMDIHVEDLMYLFKINFKKSWKGNLRGIWRQTIYISDPPHKVFDLITPQRKDGPRFSTSLVGIGHTSINLNIWYSNKDDFYETAKLIIADMRFSFYIGRFSQSHLNGVRSMSGS